MAEVKFCENNFFQGTDEVKERIENELEDVTVQVDSCLGFCSDCAAGPYALVDNEMVKADSPEELFEKIKEKIS